MRRLRGEDGCPWDREQTLHTLKPYLVEESYEVLDAIDRNDMADLCEELGDLILQPVFQAQIATESGSFTIEDSLNSIAEKLIRRHPHVFGDTEASTSADVVRNWEQIKREEKAQGQRNGDAVPSMLESVPRALPALAEAQRITSRVAKVGFDWPSVEEVEEKLHEELAELEEALEQGWSAERIQDEFGDILFVLANLARFLKLDAEQALRGSSAKFRARFAYIEQRLVEQGKDIHATSLDEMEALWQEAKHRL
jgi:tetrapyrrole methylase family protein/MazG family protein